MKVKKTWFSYILWLFATGFSIYFTYYALTNTVKYFDLPGSGQMEAGIAYTAAAVVFTALVCLLLRFLVNKIRFPRMYKWLAFILHILIFLAVGCMFLYTRLVYPQGSEMQLYCFFQLSDEPFSRGLGRNSILEILYPELVEKIVLMLEGVSYSAFEKFYTSFLSVLFLFFGNLRVFIVFAAIGLQILTFLLLVFVGFKMQKGVFRWIPALVYTFLPMYNMMVADYGPSNFVFCFFVLILALIWLHQKANKSRTCSHILTAVWGTLVCIFMLCAKWDVLFEGVKPFQSEGIFLADSPVYTMTLLAGAVSLLLYCVGYAFNKTDITVIYLIPVLFGSGLFFVLQRPENDSSLFLGAFVMFFMLLTGMEGLKSLFTYAPVMAKESESTNETKDAEKTEISNSREMPEESDIPKENELSCELPENEEAPENTDTGVIRVSDILGMTKEEKAAEMASQEITDKTAMIENVLPMPKKHENRNPGYSFEPPEDMMHYDVEIENDEYDYT